MLTGKTETEIDRQMEEEKEIQTDRESGQQETEKVCVGDGEKKNPNRPDREIVRQSDESERQTD